MATPVVVIGIGQLGAVFSQGFLKCGHPVFPVVRGVAPSAVAACCADPELVLAAVAETDLDAVLAGLPDSWKDRLFLLQNELLPPVWQAHGILSPTVAAVWFEKKKGMDVHVLRPTVLGGPKAGVVARALAGLGIPTRVLTDPVDLHFALVCKNVFVLTINIAGLVTGGTTGDLWINHRDLALAVADEVLAIQRRLAGGLAIDADKVLADLGQAMLADPVHRCAGRVAAQRLERAIAAAGRLGIVADRLCRIRQQTGATGACG